MSLFDIEEYSNPTRDMLLEKRNKLMVDNFKPIPKKVDVIYLHDSNDEIDAIKYVKDGFPKMNIDTVSRCDDHWSPDASGEGILVIEDFDDEYVKYEEFIDLITPKTSIMKLKSTKIVNDYEVIVIKSSKDVYEKLYPEITDESIRKSWLEFLIIM